MKVVLATRNAHKLREIAAMAPEITWTSLPDELGDPPETGQTFVANALEKARFGAAAAQAWCLADDSGLEVDALAGRPGVFSRRYSAEATDAANNRKLLSEMTLQLNRRARYRCVLALVPPPGAGQEHVVQGTCEGVIAVEPRGAGGFGYDPLFLPDATPGHTMAELSPDEKAAVSHRGAAMRGIVPILARLSRNG